jgi:4-aminobutyrate aminotransferase/(S)-3-amino-2-methylpropionate transaminase
MVMNELQSAEHVNVLQERIRVEKADINDVQYTCQCDESKMYAKKIFPVKANDMFVWGKNDEKPYLDLVLGYSSVNLGHNCAELKEIVSQALEHVIQIHAFHTPYQIELSRILVEALGAHEPYKVYFDVGGTNATSAAFRMVRAFTNRKKIVAFNNGFHGVGYASAAISDPAFITKEHYGYNPILEDVIRIPFPNEYYGIHAADCINQLEKVLAQEDKPAAVFLEPIQGAGGFIIGPREFISAVRELTLKYDVLLVDDEIQVGMGRAGYLYSIQHYNIIPDIVLLSKSLAGGYYPLSAIIARAKLFDTLTAKSTSFQTTFNNSAFGTYIAYYVLEYINKNSIFDNVRKQGPLFLEGLACLKEFPWVKNIRGVGLAIAFDIVETESATIPDNNLAKAFVDFALDEHILIYASGVHRHVIKIAPPINISTANVQYIVERLYNLAFKFTRTMS